jgi:hypothetical protein
MGEIDTLGSGRGGGSESQTMAPSSDQRPWSIDNTILLTAWTEPDLDREL